MQALFAMKLYDFTSCLSELNERERVGELKVLSRYFYDYVSCLANSLMLLSLSQKKVSNFMAISSFTAFPRWLYMKCLWIPQCMLCPELWHLFYHFILKKSRLKWHERPPEFEFHGRRRTINNDLKYPRGICSHYENFRHFLLSPFWYLMKSFKFFYSANFKFSCMVWLNSSL